MVSCTHRDNGSRCGYGDSPLTVALPEYRIGFSEGRDHWARLMRGKATPIQPPCLEWQPSVDRAVNLVRGAEASQGGR